MSSVLEQIEASQQQAAASKHLEWLALVRDLATDVALKPAAVAETLKRLGKTTAEAAAAVKLARERLAAKQRIERNKLISARSPELEAQAEAAREKFRAAELEFNDTMRGLRVEQNTIASAMSETDLDRRNLMNGCTNETLLAEEQELIESRKGLAPQVANISSRLTSLENSIALNQTFKADAQKQHGAAYPTPKIDGCLAEQQAEQKRFRVMHDEARTKLQAINDRLEAIRQEKLDSII